MPQAPRAMVVVNGNDTRHDLLSAAQVFQQLGVEAGFATRRAMGTSRFADPRPETAEADVYLLYTAGGQFTTAQQRALAGAVAAGKGLVAVHATNDLPAQGGVLDEAWRPLFSLLGSRHTGYGPLGREGRQRVETVADHPVTEGVGTFEVFDGLPEWEFADDHVTVLAGRGRPDGTRAPVLYVREVGAGRVVCLALGHDMRAWGEPAVRTLVRRALVWAARTGGAGTPTTDTRTGGSPATGTDARRNDAG